jgi:hypothetical protein
MALVMGAGYLLGRRRRARLAAVVTAAALGGAGGVTGRLLRKGTGMLASSDVLGKVSPELGEITDLIRGDLLDAGKGAATAAVSARIGSLSDRLHDRADVLRHATGDGQEAPADDEDEAQNGGGSRGARGDAGAERGERAADEAPEEGRTSGAAPGRGPRRAAGDRPDRPSARARRGSGASPPDGDEPAGARRGHSAGRTAARTGPARSPRAASPVRRTGR